MDERINTLVSIIMPCYNCEQYVSESIESVLNQTYTNFELLVINDDSTDRTGELLSRYALKDPRIRILSNNVNLGVAETRNIGIRESKGKYISFCDSDDLWEEFKLSKQIPFLNKYGIVCSDYYIINEKSEKIKYVTGPEVFGHNQLLKLNLIPNSSAIINKDLINSEIVQKKVGHEDYLMWLELTMPNRKVYRIQEPLIKYRKHNNSISSNKWKAVKWTWVIYYRELKLNLFKSSYFFIHYVSRNLMKHFLK